MTDDDFESELRRGLATLAREAVPERATVGARVADVTDVVAEREPRARRVLAAAVAVVVIAATVAVAAALRHDEKPTGRVEQPQPLVTAIASSPLGPRDSQASVFTGKEVLIWGGHDQEPSGEIPSASAADPSRPTTRADGAAYDVSTGRWHALPPAPIVARYNATAVWTGTEMLVVGGLSDAVAASANDVTRQGAAYDPVRNRWRRIPDAPICVERFGVWTGTRLVVGGNCSGTPFRLAAYDPARNTWTDLPAPADAFQLVEVGTRLYAWNGHSNRGARFDPEARRWLPLPELSAGGNLDSIAVAYDRTRLAVVGPRVNSAGETLGEAELDFLDPTGRSWHRVTSPKVGPPMDEVVATRDTLVWNLAPGFGWFRGDPSAGVGEFASVASGPVSLDRFNGTLLAIGGGRVFFWGGQSLPNGASETSRPSDDGGIIEFP